MAIPTARTREAELERALAAYRRLDELDEPLPPVRFEREPGRRPLPRENPCNAWAWRARVRGADEGPLEGWRVAVKDNVAVAGLPMAAGSALLEGYVPDVDATIVDRILAAGATVLGKAACEDLCYSGGSHTSVTGPVRNPHDETRMAGGSSSGCGALVATGEVELALGTDQGGSIAIPSAWCGVVGIKPTFGLLPYSGILPVEASIDHAGVIARTVRDAALALDVLAGPDGLDPRQAGVARDPRGYADAPGEDASALRVALLEEGFDWPGASDPSVDDVVRSRVARRFGARRVRVPLHRDAPAIMHAISTAGAYRTFFEGAPTGPPGGGLHLTGLADAWAEGLDARADALSPTVQQLARMGRLALDRFHGRFYAKAQNLRRALAAQFDEAFRRADVLALPAVPFLPRRIPAPDAPPEEVVEASFQSHNTCSFDLVGCPTLTIPAGSVDGLPAGLLLVAPRGEERRLLAAGAAAGRAEKPTS